MIDAIGKMRRLMERIGEIEAGAVNIETFDAHTHIYKKVTSLGEDAESGMGITSIGEFTNIPVSSVSTSEPI